ncbi:hypothetical protein, partial [Streptomyces bottropensis]|uniref:hypothetical protein n=1 Tax=Streptomyces bottropensis TaxID=42235 RepID=UPI0036904D1D
AAEGAAQRGRAPRPKLTGFTHGANLETDALTGLSKVPTETRIAFVVSGRARVAPEVTLLHGRVRTLTGDEPISMIKVSV